MNDSLSQAIWNTFFDGGVAVCVLPSVKSPRLFFEDKGAVSRYRAAGFYPAFSGKARWFRKAIQVLAFAGAVPRQTACGDDSELRNFLGTARIEDCDLVVMIGTSGPTQKAVALVKREQRIIACLKYGVSAAARERIRHEASVLKQLPPGVAPAFLESGSLGDGDAVLMSYVEGRAFPVCTPVPVDFLRRLYGEGSYAFLDHPWVQTMQTEPPFRPESYPELMHRQWPVVILHGDFAPWNLIRCSRDREQKSGGRSLVTDHSAMNTHPWDLCAIDWESAVIDGFPFIDAPHYVIQSAQNLYDWSPSKTADEAVRSLLNMDRTLSQGEARALCRLCIDWIAFRDGLDLSATGDREGWYRNVKVQLSGETENE